MSPGPTPLRIHGCGYCTIGDQYIGLQNEKYNKNFENETNTKNNKIEPFRNFVFVSSEIVSKIFIF